MGFKLAKRCSNSSISTCPETPTSSSEFLEIPNTPGQSVSEKNCFRHLKKWCWENDVTMEDSLIMRFANFYNFNEEATKLALERHQDNHFLKLQMRGPIVKQFQKGALFPLPGLKTKRQRSEVCYFRPSRFCPKTADSSVLIENLCYVLNDLSTTEEQCQHGITFLANMKSFSTKLYDEQFWLELLNVLQGNVIPVHIASFIVLNPPTWFGRIWRQMNTHMSPDFLKKVRLVEREDLPDYFEQGYETYMPSDMQGWRKTSEMVEDYIDRRVFIDKQAVKKKKHRFSESLELRLLEVPLEV
ncbi:unnamed protein product [Cylindrotheca closterium]|uniref:CRAL-TRIO domain-containing protein n=1 Tax=Cylindrotheca closterium TaxID=2856 RepID=A0AAD2GBQ1_9STRA|nr:unnamed protein product [Cylindrotheca closterium]